MKGCTKRLKINRSYFDSDGEECFEDKIISIEVKPGTLAGTKFRYENCSDETPGIIPADIVFIACDKAHPEFVRKGGANIEYTALIEFEAANGVELEIPTLDENDKILLASKKPLNLSVTKNYPNRGLPLVNNANKRGDLIVRFEIVSDDHKGIKSLICVNI